MTAFVIYVAIGVTASLLHEIYIFIYPPPKEFKLSFSSGDWVASSSRSIDHSLTCSITNDIYETDDSFESVGVNFVQTSGRLEFFLEKSSWDIPANTNVETVLSFGDFPSVRAQMTGNGYRLTATVKLEAKTEFIRYLTSSTTLTVTFPDGNERPWIASLEGVDDAYAAMRACDSGRLPTGSRQVHLGETQPFKAK